MVLALIIAGIAKGCGNDEPTSSPVTTTTGTTSGGTTSTADTKGEAVIASINQAITAGGGIQFATGQTTLTDKSKTTLDAVADILARNPTVNAEVGGHTDTQGDADKNKEISQQRAQAVVDYLVGKGIKVGQLTAVGYGETQPLEPDDTTEALREKNRRVEFKLLP